MKKIKKLFTSISLFFINSISKAFAVEYKYGVIDPIMVEDKYGVLEPTMGEKISGIAKTAMPIILFIIGLVVIFNKKKNSKVKAIILSSLLAIGIIGWIILNNL